MTEIEKNLELGKEYWVKVYKTGSFEIDSLGNRKEVFQSNTGDTFEVYLNSEYVNSECATVIPEREKVTIPPYVADWVEQCKVRGDLADAINPIDFCTDKKVADWYEEQEFAEEILAKAYLVGYVVEEPLGVLLVDMPRGGFWKYNFLYRDKSGEFTVNGAGNTAVLVRHAYKVTEAEAKEKYPNFKWVSLEGLENEIQEKTSSS